MATKRRSPARPASRIRGGVIIAKPYTLLEDCIEGGLKGGLRRLFKHRTSPSITEDELVDERNIDTVLNYIMVDICERFDFPEPGGDNGEEEDPPPARGRHAG